MGTFLTIIGIFLIVQGFAVYSQAVSAFQQIVGALFLGFGFILIGLGGIVGAINRVLAMLKRRLPIPEQPPAEPSWRDRFGFTPATKEWRPLPPEQQAQPSGSPPNDWRWRATEDLRLAELQRQPISEKGASKMRRWFGLP